MKIALVSPYDYPYPGGVTKHITNLSRRYRELGHQTTIFAPSSQSGENGLADVINLSSFVVPVPYNGSVARLSFSPFLAARVSRRLRQERYDILHLHEPVTPVLPWMVMRGAQKASPGTALIGTFHSYQEEHHWGALPALLTKSMRPILRRAVSHLDGRIAVSGIARDYAHRASPGEYRVIPNGVDAALFGNPSLEPLPAYTDGLNILFVGRLEPRKGFGYLIEAYARIKDALPQARLLVVGPNTPADRRPFERRLRDLSAGGVHFIGHVPEEDLPRYYQSCHIFCAPSVGGESFGMVLLEAMAAGAPIVASDIDGYRSLINHGAEGLLIPPRDAVALADALTYLLRHPHLRQAMGAQGKATARHYTWERVADQVLDYYGTVLAAKRGATRTFGGQRHPQETLPSEGGPG